MKKRKVILSLLLCFLCNIVSPLTALASTEDETTLTITFSSQDGKVSNEDSITPVLVGNTKSKNNDGGAYMTTSAKKRLPMTGEEYNFVLSFLGGVVLLLTILFFFIHIYERKGEGINE